MSGRWKLIIGGAACILAVVGVRGFLAPRGGGTSFFQKSRMEGFSQKAKEAVSQGKWDEALSVYQEMIARAPTPEFLAKGYLGMGEVQFGKKDLLAAKETYERILRDFPNAEATAVAQDQLGKVNMAILFSSVTTPDYKQIEVRPGDTLGKIAATHGTTIDLLARANQLKGSLIRSGMKLKAPAERFSLVVDKSQNQLTLKLGEEIFKIYPVATGEHNSTPVGTFKVINKLVDPVWYSLGAVVPPDSPENVLGSRWMGINEMGYGIHGTRDPESIGKQATQGCVRMQNRDVEELYAVVPIGAEVTIID